MAEMKPTLNIGEAAAALGLSRETLKRAVLAGQVPALHLDDRWVFSRRAIETFLATGCWPNANADPEEIAELVVRKLMEIERAGMEARVAIMSYEL